MNSAIYTGTIRHRRLSPRENNFTYRIAMFLLDPEELPSIFNLRGILTLNKSGLYAFHRKNYLGDPSKDLTQCVRDLIFSHTGEQSRGPIRILTQISYFGFCFNPVSFYYCFNEADTEVEFIVTEITNTPWNERHSYVLRCQGKQRLEKFYFEKSFHVSPFMDMAMNYKWLLSVPSSREQELTVHMENIKDVASDGSTSRFFDATLQMSRTEMSRTHLVRVLLAYPFMTFKTALLIYFQALILFLKRVPFHAHPSAPAHLAQTEPGTVAQKGKL